MRRSVRKPDFFIVGAPKCGTTAMANYLKQHPEIFVPEKRIPFFAADLGFTRPRFGRDDFLSLFFGTNLEKQIGYSAVWYLYSKTAAIEIKELCSDVKIIIMLRNPVDMVYSLHSQLLYQGDENIEDFEAALEAEADRKKGLRIPHADLFIPVEGFFYREVAKFTSQVKRYLDVFGREKVHIIIFDDFKKDTAGVYKDTLSFLGVHTDFQPDFPVINPNKSVRSNKLHDFLLHPPKTARFVISSMMPLSLRRILVERLKRVNVTYSPRPPMDPELRRCLQKEFSEEVAGLSELLERDLTYWCRNGISGSKVE